MPKDRFGREINYLRISVIDHCNLRCVYCMPLRGLSFVPSPELLTAEEIETVARAAVQVGFHKFRLTGGEPTLRSDIVEIVSRIAATPGIAAAEEAGLRPIKINCVVTRDYNDMDVADLARRALERDWHVRFIELMPLGGGETAHVALAQFVPTRETRQRIESELGPLLPLSSANPSDESKNFRFAEGKGVVGFISPVSEPYCGPCNRMRLTADGKFHLCLLNDDELDVKKALRTGGGVPAVAPILARAAALKPTGHRLA